MRSFSFSISPIKADIDKKTTNKATSLYSLLLFCIIQIQVQKVLTNIQLLLTFCDSFSIIEKHTKNIMFATQGCKNNRGQIHLFKTKELKNYKTLKLKKFLINKIELIISFILIQYF